MSLNTDWVFSALPMSRSLPIEILEKSLAVLRKELEKDELDVRKKKSALQAAVYLACVDEKYPLAFSSLFDEDSQIHSFMIILKEMLGQPSLNQATALQSRRLIKSYSISLMNYKKIEEIIEKFTFQGNFEHIIKFNQVIWMFFIVTRKTKYGSSEVLSDCGCLIVSVIYLVVSNTPEGLAHIIKIPVLEYLCECFRISVNFVENFVEKSQESLREILQSFGQVSLDECLTVSRIQKFLDHLFQIYESKIEQSDLDERIIQNVVVNNELLFTPVKRSTSHIDFIDTSQVTLSTKLKEVNQKPVSLLIQTPITASMECNSWISKTLEEFNEVSLSKLENFSEIKTRADSLKSVFVAGISIRLSQKSVDDISKLYFIALDSLIRIEKSKKAEVSGILQNDKFHRALFACSVETILFIMNPNTESFEDLLSVFEISAFDFWKNIKSFIQFNIRMPGQIRRHFIEIEERILCKDGWDENSQVAQAVNRINSETFLNELSHPSFSQFFKNVLSYSAFKLTQICNFLDIKHHVQEKIWSTFKYFLSEKTENMIGRHIDQIIICSIYAVCKAEKINEVTFNKIYEGFFSIFQTKRSIFEKIKIREKEIGNLTDFYNKIFIELVKDYLLSNANLINPRISVLHPMSPLNASLAFQSPRPFMTPRTKRLYAFGEHTKNALEGINSMIHGTAKKLDFSAPMKKIKREEE